MSLPCSSLALALVALAGCGGGDGPSTPTECNPLGTTGCVLPFPSSIYQRPDTTSPTGIRLDFPLGALPGNVDGVEIDPAWINARTGFSPMTQILVTFPGGVDDSNLVFWDDLAASTTDASPTVIVDMTTGQRVAHFAEIDVNETNVDNQIVYLRPAARLAGGTRYAVAIKKTLHARGGIDLLPIAPAFQALLDGGETGHPRLDAVRDAYPAVFAALEAAGVPKTELVTAFDFTTADDDDMIVDQLAARDAAMAVVGDAEQVSYTITLDESPDARDPMIARRVMFNYVTPRVASPAGFQRGTDGRVIAMGTTTAPASIIIPPCATPANPARIVIYGHGFFGSLEESMGGYVRRLSRDTCIVVIGGVWRGMSEAEVPAAILALNDVNKLPAFNQHMWQGMVDFMTLAKLAKGKLAREQLVNNPGSGGAQSIVDTSQIFYYGISQGHILGSTLFAFDPTMQRGVFSVGGANWALMFERSKNWDQYSVPLKGAYDSPPGTGEMNSVILQQVIEMGFEIVDGGAVAQRVLNGGVPGTPTKQFLHYMSAGDCQVPNLASELQARSIGLPLLTPSVQAPYGITGMPSPLASAFVIMDEHPDPLPPPTNLLFGYDNVAHERLRRRTATVQQIDRFFSASADIVNFCTGACDCAAGNCGTLP